MYFIVFYISLLNPNYQYKVAINKFYIIEYISVRENDIWEHETRFIDIKSKIIKTINSDGVSIQNAVTGGGWETEKEIISTINVLSGDKNFLGFPVKTIKYEYNLQSNHNISNSIKFEDLGHISILEDFYNHDLLYHEVLPSLFINNQNNEGYNIKLKCYKQRLSGNGHLILQKVDRIEKEIIDIIKYLELDGKN